jgi:phosphoribosylamine--glycine ligase
MKVLLIDPAGAFVDFALKCQNAGHEVKQWIRKVPGHDDSKIGQGLVPRVYNWRLYMNWADIIVLSDNAYENRDLEKYFKQGYPILGANDLMSDLELNRKFGQDILQKAGLDIIPSVTFKEYNEAIDYVKNKPIRYVSKPSGDADKALSYVSKSAADMIYMLERWKSKGKVKMPFILQEFVPGIEVAVGSWIGPGGFSKHITENFEFKKLMSSNYGVNTGEMGTVLKYVKESNLFDETLKKLEDYLVYNNYCGYVDLAFIIDDKGSPRPLEWTVRPGWPLFNIQSALHKGDPVEWMVDLLEGKDTLKVSDKHAVGVVGAIPDFPFTKSTGRDPNGYPIYGLENVMDDVHLCEVMIGKAPVLKGKEIVYEDHIVSAGDYILVATGTGNDVCTASKKAYEVMDEISIPNSLIVRDDIGERLEKELPKLQKYGYCTEFVYEKKEEVEE